MQKTKAIPMPLMVPYITKESKSIRIPSNLYKFLQEFSQDIMYPVAPNRFGITAALPMFAHADFTDGSTITMYGKAGQDMYVAYVYPPPHRQTYLYKIN